MELEGPLLRVPFEALKASARTRARLATELAEVCASLKTAQADAALDDAQQRLTTLKRKFASAAEAEAAALQQLRARTQHLAAAVGADADALRCWEGVRLERLLAEHLLRSGQPQAGAALASAAGVGVLVDTALHGEVAAVAASLRRGDAQPALAWCDEHRARLKKARSALEFRLRLQQFVQLASAGQAGAAIAHARAHVAPLAAGGAHLSELQCAMAFLVFRPGAPGARSPLVASAAPTWAALAEEFGAEAARVHGLPPVSGVALRLQAGLCALNTAHASREGGGGARQDPLADPLLAQLATGLPHCKHVHSRLVCPITQQVMNEDNPPAALPNGYVYSRAALEALAAEGGGTLCCPRTGSGPYDVAALQKVFIA